MKKCIIILFLFAFSNIFSQSYKLDSARIYYNHAIYSYNNKQYDDALMYSLKSWQLNCNAQNSEAIFLAGMIYFNRGDFNAALKCFRSSASLYKGMVMYGRCWYELNNFNNAYYELNLAIYWDKENPSAFFYRGLTNIAMGDTIGAIKDLTYPASFKNIYTDLSKKELNKLNNK